MNNVRYTYTNFIDKNGNIVVKHWVGLAEKMQEDGKYHAFAWCSEMHRRKRKGKVEWVDSKGYSLK